MTIDELEVVGEAIGFAVFALICLAMHLVGRRGERK
jgi:hypothetical protein